MQFIDIKVIHAHSTAQIDAAVAQVFEHGRYINGPEVYELEATLGEFLGTPSKPLHCVAAASGIMALEVALRTLGIGPDDEAISLPFHPYLSEADQNHIIEAVLAHEQIEATHSDLPLRESFAT